jgi:hypothetical protein
VKHWLLILFVLPFVATVWAADAPASSPRVQLKVKPVLCVLDARTPQCRMSFLVVWRSSQSGYYCLYNDFGKSPVSCWNDKQKGEANDERNIQHAFRYWMTGDNEAMPLAVVTVEVLRVDSDDRRRRRRGRHVWDIL